MRSKALKLLEPIAEEMRRQAMITARHTLQEDGCFVELAMSDGAGEIVHLRLLVAGEDQAKRIEKRFRKTAEKTYHQIVELLDGEEK